MSLRVLLGADDAAQLPLARRHVRGSAEIEVVGEVVGVDRLPLQLRLQRPDRLVVVTPDTAAWRRVCAGTEVTFLAAPANEPADAGSRSRFRKLSASIQAHSAPIPSESPLPMPAPDGSATRVVALVASTGGPDALARVLRDLPADLPAGIVIAQHILVGMTRSLAHQLSMAGPLPVVEARNGETIVTGQVLLATAGLHLEVVRLGRDAWRVRLGRKPDDAPYFPSADVLLASVARNVGPAACAVVLTGMGDDGARGLLRVREAGGHTIAQDEATSSVYGMPRRARELGGAVVSLPIDAIAAEIVRAVARASTGGPACTRPG